MFENGTVIIVIYLIINQRNVGEDKRVYIRNGEWKINYPSSKKYIRYTVWINETQCIYIIKKILKRSNVSLQ